MVERSERKWLWVFALVVMLLTSLPYLLAYQVQGANWRYTGFVFGVEDGNSYIAKMLTGASGSWLFRTPYTAYPQRGVLLFFFYILLGKLVAQPGAHEQLVALYQIFRFIGGLLAIAATYDFCALFLKEVGWRRLATVLAVLGGGLGWLIVFGLKGLWQEGMPLEYYSPEAFGFLSVFGLTHLAFARAFLLWGLRDYLLTRASFLDRRAWLRAGLLWLGTVIMQPMTGAVALAVIGIYLALYWVTLRLHGAQTAGQDWDEWRIKLINGLRIAIIVLPVVLYTLLSFKLDAFLSHWEQQSYILSPAFGDYLLAYAIALPLAIWGILKVIKEDIPHGELVVGWALAFPLLAYAPFSSQRRLVEGVWVALSILAIKGLSELRPILRRISYGWLGLAFPTIVFLWLGAMIAVSHPLAPLFIPTGEVGAFNHLAVNAPAGSVLLASFETANPLPAWAPVHMLIGHGPESINGPALKEQVACFYRPGCPDADRQSLIKTFQVAYVFWGPNERALGDWDPNGASFLKQVYHQEGYQIFQVIH